MKVFVNGKEKIVPVGCTIEMLGDIIGIKKENPVAIALGEDVIEKNLWNKTKLKDGDKLTLISATCGG